MFCYRKVLQWFFSVFLICSPVPHLGRSIDGSSRTKRSVTHAQLMHDKGRALQDFRRRMWLQELLDEVHTAEVRDLPARTGPGLHLSTTGSTLHSKPPGGTKNLPISFLLEEEQATNKAQSDKDGPPRGRRRKKGRGRRREGAKRRRRVRSLGWRPEDQIHLGWRLGWRPLLGLQRALL
ncbi:parathyroid hormone-like hormone a [Pseudoliparis swirei]|uniref:parathyroid hormone-like hormone a n=1 Tax=Pseudoliparis swirei TaxID=2059687 RepID=UPI0024BE3915|nr:parathyroid hormone-like hormone a [Pseudoliparis swirei]